MFLHNDTHVDSYYAASCQGRLIVRPSLEVDLAVDVCIVGGGFTGLYTALNLADAGHTVAIVEGSRMGWGGSGRNGGQIILGFSCDMAPFEAALGLEGAREVWRLTREAAAEIRRRIATHQIDCELADGFLWTSVLPRRVATLQAWQEEAATKWGYDRQRFVAKDELPQHIASGRYQAGLLDPEGGHFHPLKYLLGLAQAAEAAGVQLYEGTRAIRYREHRDSVIVETERGRITCNKLVLACNAYLDQLDHKLSARILPVGTYMIATEPLGEARARDLLPSNHAVCDNQFVLDYFRRSADHRLLFGGKCTYTGHTPANLTGSMRADMLKVFPQLADVGISYTWGGHIDITMPRTPDFGNVGNVYWAQGFSGHGVVPTCVAGRVLAEAICGQRELFELFTRFKNPPFPGGERLGALFQALGMSWYRLRDYI